MYRLILSLVLCATAGAAPLPPWPGGTKVKRPPLLSPKHAAVLKAKPMARFSPAGGAAVPGLAPTRPLKHSLDVGMDDGQVYDVTLIEAIQRANVGVHFQYTDGCPDSKAEWVTISEWPPYVKDQPVFVELHQGKGQRVPARSFRVVEVTGATAARMAGAGVNPSVKGVRSWRGGK